ncbi:MAG: hypothetical protein HOE44_13955, partial [Candidatus Marinimicrobia bacterium]|nr:hypothetical protein [Candidatus Neomarinimicrobiota bacterium]
MATQSKTPALDVKEELAKLKINNPVKGTVVENAGIREKLGIANHEQLTVATDGVIGDFQSESIVDNATGIDVTGSVTCDGFTSTGIDDNATSTAITIDASENVGIGTTAPAAKLHIGGSSATDFDALTLRNSSGTDGSAAVLGFEASTGAEGVDAALAAQIKGIREGSGTTGALAFLTTSGGVPAERMRIESAGNVGIGTSSPAAKLDVNGTLACDGFTSTGIDDNATSTAITIANTNVEMRGNANVRVTLGTAGTSGANNSSNWVYG